MRWESERNFPVDAQDALKGRGRRRDKYLIFVDMERNDDRLMTAITSHIPFATNAWTIRIMNMDWLMLFAAVSGLSTA